MSRAAAGALLVAALACAQPGSPPGGPVDRSPPRVVGTVPAPFDTLTDLRARAVIRFDERISERLEGVSDMADAVLISPATGEPRVDRGRRELEIVPAGGWQPDRVYRIMVLPVFRDLFGNRRQEPIELVFSTGAPIPETAVAGFVQDRLTGQAVPQARVEAVRRIDAARYLTVTDTAGFFALRFLPAGAYDIRSWLDQDRDGEPDFFEAQDTADTAFGVTDTMVVELALLPMDTTAARLARAEPVDSLRIRLVFDDPFAVGDVEGTAALYLSSDSSLVTDAGRLVHGSRFDAILAAEAAARDSAQTARDTAQAARDTTQATRDTTQAGGQAESGAPVRRRVTQGGEGGGRRQTGAGQSRRPPRQEPGPPLPSRELILSLPAPLTPDTAYYVVVTGVVNIRGIPGGGGTASFRTPPAPRDTAAADTAAAGVPPDSVPPDSVPPGAGRWFR